jgi:CDP-diacylglycerol---serine O-phosphatidyltransferase
MKKFMNWRQLVPTVFTLAAMLSGFLSILFVVQGFHSDNANFFYLWAAKLIMLAMILDGLDGNVARWLKGASEFGAELDTYVDMTAFGIAPAILIFAVTMEAKDPLLRILLPSAVALSGVVRLARFKVVDPLRGQGGYAGLPITANAGWVSLFVFISQVPPSERVAEDIFSLRSGWFAVLFLTGIIVFIILQVSNVRFPKPTKKAYLFVPCVILVTLFVLLGKRQAVYIAALMLILGLIYSIAGPFFVKGMEVRRSRQQVGNDSGDAP